MFGSPGQNSSTQFSQQADELEARLAQVRTDSTDPGEIRNLIFLGWFYRDCDTEHIRCHLASTEGANALIKLTLTCPATQEQRTIELGARLRNDQTTEHLQLLARLTAVLETKKPTPTRQVAADGYGIEYSAGSVPGLNLKLDEFPHLELAYFYLSQLYANLDEDAKQQAIRTGFSRLLAEADALAPGMVERLLTLTRPETAAPGPNASAFPKAAARMRTECRFALRLSGNGLIAAETLSCDMTWPQTTGTTEEHESGAAAQATGPIYTIQGAEAEARVLLWSCFLDTGDIRIINELAKEPTLLLTATLQHHQQVTLQRADTEGMHEQPPYRVERDENRVAITYGRTQTTCQLTYNIPVNERRDDEEVGHPTYQLTRQNFTFQGDSRLTRDEHDTEPALELLKCRILAGSADASPEEHARMLTQSIFVKPQQSVWHMTTPDPHAMGCHLLQDCLELAAAYGREDLLDHVIEVAGQYDRLGQQRTSRALHEESSQGNPANVLLTGHARRIRSAVAKVGEDYWLAPGHSQPPRRLGPSNRRDPQSIWRSMGVRLTQRPLVVTDGEPDKFDEIPWRDVFTFVDPGWDIEDTSPQFWQNFSATFCNIIKSLAQKPNVCTEPEGMSETDAEAPNSETDALARNKVLFGFGSGENEFFYVAQSVFADPSICSILHTSDGVRITFDFYPNGRFQQTLPNCKEINQLLHQHATEQLDTNLFKLAEALQIEDPEERLKEIFLLAQQDTAFGILALQLRGQDPTLARFASICSWAGGIAATFCLLAAGGAAYGLEEAITGGEPSEAGYDVLYAALGIAILLLTYQGYKLFKTSLWLPEPDDNTPTSLPDLTTPLPAEEVEVHRSQEDALLA